MKKTKKTIGKIWTFLREVLVVVLGVAITLTASVLINNYKDMSTLKKNLEAVKLELENNIIAVDSCTRTWQSNVDYAKYLKSNDKKKLNIDSIKNIFGDDVFYGINYFSYSSDAFEMFKSSGTMHLISDQQVQLSLWKAYSELNILKQIIDENSKYKFEEIKKESLTCSGEKKIPMYLFYTILPIPEKMVETSKETSEKLNEIVLKLEGYKRMIE